MLYKAKRQGFTPAHPKDTSKPIHLAKSRPHNMTASSISMAMQ